MSTFQFFPQNCYHSTCTLLPSCAAALSTLFLYLGTTHSMPQAHHPSITLFPGACVFIPSRHPSALNDLLLCSVSPALHLGDQALPSEGRLSHLPWKEIFTPFHALLGFCIHTSPAALTILLLTLFVCISLHLTEL